MKKGRTVERRSATSPQSNPLWYKDATIYELHVRAFCDSNGDGLGDFPGLTQKLDYLQDLGVTALWLLPFYPSPLRDDGYDISDYTAIHPDYGTLPDFRRFLNEAHRRGLRVITEMVLNHTSDQHAWFQRSRRAAPGTRWRNFYVWSDRPDRYADARIIFKDFETSNWAWDSAAEAYVWHRFYSHQPDLNFENREVRRAILHAVDFWLDMGVDGLRLDAVPYLFERDGTNCENLPETHVFLKELRAHVDGKYSERMLLAEANQWPEDARSYFGDGDECHMAFHFPLMPRLFMAIHQEDCFPIVDILQQTPEIPSDCQWALFLRNHDELTLEMVTDEERDYMYRAYAVDSHARLNLGIRRRLAPLLGNHRRKIELMNGLLLSLPGTPVIYYGDELGMGDNVYLGDRNGVRTPMQWSPDRNAGFSRCNPQRLYQPTIIDPEYHFQTVNVEAQQNNLHSLLWWMKRSITLRNRFKTFGRGELQLLSTDNHRILAFVRRDGDEAVLVVANLSRFVQPVEVDLSAFVGFRLVELFGRTEFPQVPESPYAFMLGPHSFYWFALRPAPAAQSVAAAVPGEVQLPVIQTPALVNEVASPKLRAGLEALLPAFLAKQRWFRSKGHPIRSVQIGEVIPLGPGGAQPGVFIVLATVAYDDLQPEMYLLPLAIAREAAAERVLKEHLPAVIARLKQADVEHGAVLYDAVFDGSFGRLILEAITHRRRLNGIAGQLSGSGTRLLKSLAKELDVSAPPTVLKVEQSNTSLVYQDRLILKLFRGLEAGVNGELEIGRFLAERGFAGSPALAGALEYRRPGGEPVTVGLLQQFVRSQGDAWEYALGAVGRCFERVLTQRPPLSDTIRRGVLEVATDEIEPLANEIMGDFLQSADLIGRRTAELHLALSSGSDDPAFAPEPFTSQYQRALYQSFRAQLIKNLALLKTQLPQLTPGLREAGLKILDLRAAIEARLHRVIDVRIRAARIRCHGDYHLGQILYTGNDFVIIDFEGEPARSLDERRIKRSPLRDVAGMIRSFHYATHAVLFGPSSVIRREDVPKLEPWAGFWYLSSSATFLKGYLGRLGEAPLLPRDKKQFQVLFEALLIDKAIYELGYEINNRPDWLIVPLGCLFQLLESSA